MEDLSPRERRQARTRDAILEAARQIIAQEGRDNLSMRAIAERIDYSPAGLYEYFGSKDEIIGAVCVQGEARLYRSMAGVDHSLPHDQYLIELGMAYINFAVHNPDHFLLMFTSGIEPPAEMPDNHETAHSFHFLLKAVEQGISSGTFITRPGFTQVDMVYMAWSLVHGMAMLRIKKLAHFDYDFGAADRQVIETAIYGLTQAL